MGIYISKDKLDSYRLNLLLIHDTYTCNNDLINNKASEFLKKYQEYNKIDDKKINSALISYAKMTISYSLLETGITQMYHLFEQFIGIYFNIDLEKNHFTIAGKQSKKYEYNLKENEYFELVNKYRLLNNAIKHGGIENLRKKYPNLINDTHNGNDYGTILDDKLNITENELDECCSCLYKYIDEMNAYFEDMGYIEEEV